MNFVSLGLFNIALSWGFLCIPIKATIAEKKSPSRARRWQRIQLHPQTEPPPLALTTLLDCANPAKLPFVEVRINGVPGWFVLDTGSSHTIIAPHFAQKSGIADTRFYHPVEGNVHGRYGTFYRVSTLDFAHATYQHFHVLGLPLNHLQEALARPVDGIIGANVLLRHPFMLDIKAKTFQFIDPAEFDQMPWVSHHLDTGRIALDVEIGPHHRLPMILDSGATRSMIRSTDWTGLRHARSGEILVDINTSTSPRIDEFAGNGPFCIGSLCVDGIEFKISDSRLLGIDLMERHIIKVDPARRRTMLKPHPAAPAVRVPHPSE